MRLSLASIVVAAPFLSGTALAQECNDSSSQMELNRCAAKVFEAADRELNADFRDIQRRLGKDADTKRLLVETQRAWILFRDAECTFQTSGAAQGSIFPLVFANCKTTLTNDRIEQLRAYLACEEGDMSCPVPAAE
ncbi:hypothetical protein MesoLjLc_34610 [Mesorhizobium sp. L-8-10]|uniref:lysozyme inhibitor LprI family protein n=1 Tax=unclassified Mesorhizobium TaxID=325217 RepID=UPI0019292514|nr:MULTISPECIES: lysozyme inhibitor LprI family protein [unclassified Mesorhizobium]BCH23801.1 hypothetical protein MesoLjLb_35860 [Mesorhizobium sp. L-8-3]BCH31531.1 hypothetical protein MesoLjLc_34610 [Mesorhizobium sp. L-8-10]